MKFKFVHTPKPRQFEYIPRFYDPEKEEREARKRAVLGDAYDGPDGPAAYRPGQYIHELRIRRGIIAERDKLHRRHRRNLRTIVLLVLLLFLGWWLMRSDFTGGILEVLFRQAAQ
jgi:hypothetical protein